MSNLHGGNIQGISRKFNINESEIIDFSGNINPLGVPDSAKQTIIRNIDSISTYPDIQYLSLKEKISQYTGSKAEHILVGNGTSELISSFIKIISPKKAVVLSPAYSEYEREIILHGGEVIRVAYVEREYDFQLDLELLFEKLNDEVSLLIICNPNNPTGSPIYINELKKILDHCTTKNIFVMVDETYVEFSLAYEDISSAGLVQEYDNLFTIRGISKFFACPGIRLGYAMCRNENIINQITEKRDPWSINILAVFAGEAMFSDINFIEKSKKLIFSERQRIIDNLSSISTLKIFKTHANFILVKILDDRINATKVFDQLIANKMVIRNASTFPFLDESFFRFCVLSPLHNDMLIDELKRIFVGY